MLRLIQAYWFFIGIAVMVALAYATPALGVIVRDFGVLKIGIFLAFLISGLTLDTSRIVEQIKDAKALLLTLLSVFVLTPMLAYLLATLAFPQSPDLVIGVCIIATAPVTVASGTVMTAIARGNVPLSLLMCVMCNFIGIFTIPISLSLLLQGQYEIHLSVIDTIFKLLQTVIVPIILGQILRLKLKTAVQTCKGYFSIFQQCIVLLIIFNAVSSSAQHIMDAGILVAYAVGFVIVLHSLVMAMNYVLAKAARLDAPSTAAITIHGSQKTLTVSYVVWANNFAALFPMALLPSIAYHLVQMIMDTFVAHAFLKRSTPDRSRKPDDW